MEGTPVVYVVDDDPAVRKSCGLLLRSVQQESIECASASEFLQRYDSSRPSCLVLDVRMKGMGGMELLDLLSQKGIRIPTLVTTGHADVPLAVRAIKTGAIDLLEKPCNPELLLERIQQALQIDIRRRQEEARRLEFEARVSKLTPREKAVMNLMLEGRTNKEIADQLGVSRKTLDIHRARVLEKTQARNVVELLRATLNLDGGSSNTL